MNIHTPSLQIADAALEEAVDAEVARGDGVTFGEINDHSCARAVISAFLAAELERGYALAPREATDEMRKAASRTNSSLTFKGAWRVMFNAFLEEAQ